MRWFKMKICIQFDDTNLLADTGKTASFATLVDRINNPVYPCVTTDLRDKVGSIPMKR
jgi:hypothetical protein